MKNNNNNSNKKKKKNHKVVLPIDSLLTKHLWRYLFANIIYKTKPQWIVHITGTNGLRYISCTKKSHKMAEVGTKMKSDLTVTYTERFY